MKALVVVAAVTLVVGCSVTARIYLEDGSIIEGEIKRSDATSVYVSDEDSEGEFFVDRLNIRKIDHPGDVHAIVGTVLAILGLGAAIEAMVDEPTCEGMFCDVADSVVIPGLAFGITGTLVSIWGWATWGASKSAAAFDEPKVSPLAMTDGERTYYGIGMSWSW